MANERLAMGGDAISVCEVDSMVEESVVEELIRDVAIIKDITVVQVD